MSSFSAWNTQLFSIIITLEIHCQVGKHNMVFPAVLCTQSQLPQMSQQWLQMGMGICHFLNSRGGSSLPLVMPCVTFCRNNMKRSPCQQFAQAQRNQPSTFFGMRVTMKCCLTCAKQIKYPRLQGKVLVRCPFSNSSELTTQSF